jgi:hypothetical protein
VQRTSVSWSIAILSPLCLAALACGAEGTGDDGAGAAGGVAGTGAGGMAGAGLTAGTGSPGGAAGSGVGGAAGSAATGGASGSVATGGASGSVATGGASGSVATGGAAGTMATGGGAGVGPAGAAGMAGAGGAMGGASGAGGSGGAVSCNITIGSQTLGEIKTVGIIEWSTDLAPVQSARIEFGLDTTYGMVAPVDLTAANYRTLLLGMKQDRTYHFRIVANNGTADCVGPDATIDTELLTNGLPELDISVEQPEKVAPGFLITGQYTGTGGGGSPAYIFDSDGDIVWAYQLNRDVTGARMSYDGKYMWINSANVPNSMSNVHRVSMDGSMDENLSSQFVSQNHQLTILPDETVAFYAYGSNGCDDVKERAPNGMVKTIVNAETAHGAGGPCHLNNIQYSPEDDTLLFSDLDNDNITKVTRTGETVWVISGSTSDFTGDGASWDTQHGIHVLGVDRFLVFNNASNQTGSHALEILLNLQSMTATKVWEYTEAGRLHNQVMGDVQRLPNGNTIVAYSTRGVLQEVDAEGEIVQDWGWPVSGAFGYIEHRPTLYGPPPK